MKFDLHIPNLIGNEDNSICLNRKLPRSALKFLKVVEFLYLADGGSNRLLELMEYNSAPIESIREFKSYQSQNLFIIGDLDSISATTRNQFSNLSISMEKVADQDSTDFQKCLTALMSKLESSMNKEENIKLIVLGGFGGRYDHFYSNIHTLFVGNSKYPGLQIYLIGETNLCFLLPPGNHEIVLSYKEIMKTCGLTPFHIVRKVKTTGLRWELNNVEMSVFGCVSTSNELHDREVMIETTDPIIWFSELDLKSNQILS